MKDIWYKFTFPWNKQDIHGIRLDTSCGLVTLIFVLNNEIVIEQEIL